jgi:hypothetical protein
VYYTLIESNRLDNNTWMLSDTRIRLMAGDNNSICNSDIGTMECTVWVSTYVYSVASSIIVASVTQIALQGLLLRATTTLSAVLAATGGAISTSTAALLQKVAILTKCSKIFTGAVILLNIIMAGLSIYSLVKRAEECEKIDNEIRKSRETYHKFYKSLYSFVDALKSPNAPDDNYEFLKTPMELESNTSADAYGGCLDHGYQDGQFPQFCNFKRGWYGGFYWRVVGSHDDLHIAGGDRENPYRFVCKGDLGLSGSQRMVFVPEKGYVLCRLVLAKPGMFPPFVLACIEFDDDSNEVNHFLFRDANV